MRAPTLTLPLGPATAGGVVALEGAVVVVEDDAESSYLSSDAALLPPPPLRLSIAMTIEGRGRWRYLTHEDAWRPVL